MMKKYLTAILFLIFFETGTHAQCTADFSYSVTGLYQYGFINLSSPFGDTTITYAWNFGDGDTSKHQNPSHTFSSFGTYVVCLTMHDPTFNCSASHCDTVVISCPAVAGFTYIKGTDYTYNFNYSTTANDIVTWHWNFGDGDTSNVRNPPHTFAHTGVYDVCLTVTDVATQCTSTYCQEVTICTAEANFTHTNSSQYDYSFTDNSFGQDASTTYLWNFGDGDSSILKNPTYVFPQPGTYDVCLTINVHDSMCTNQYCSTISVACPDSANFSFTNIGGLTFAFTDISTGEDSSATWSWSFGDGTASPVQNPQHMFTSPGTHDVCLTIRNVDQGCTNTWCATVAIACNDSASFTYTHSGLSYEFTDASLGEDTSAVWLWNFGDGDTSHQKNPVHTYGNLGTYQVCLKMTDADVDCYSQFCESIDVINGIEELSSTNHIRLYPNPSSGLVTLDLNGLDAVNVFIINQLGERVRQISPVPGKPNYINTETLQPGIYQVVAQSNTEIVCSRLVVVGK